MNLYKSLIFILYPRHIPWVGIPYSCPIPGFDHPIRHIRHRAGHPPTYTTRQRGKRRSPGNPYFPSHFISHKTRSLAELLTDHTSIYIKSLGTGALSTASFRGTSASQTRVNWNGINITPPLSGTFDFSQIPVFFYR